jgi:ABC-type transport system substrate-binding protein
VARALAQTPKRGGVVTISYYPGEPKNQSHINDPIVADLLVRQRRTHDVAKRKELIFGIQRDLAKQRYHIQIPSPIHVSVRDAARRNDGPNFGYDYGGRLMAAWLDR